MKLSQKHFGILLGILSSTLPPITWYTIFSLAAQQFAGFPVNPEHTSLASTLLLTSIGLNGYFGYFIFKQARQVKTNLIHILEGKLKEKKLKKYKKTKLKRKLETLKQIRFFPPIFPGMLLATLQITPFTSVLSGVFPFLLDRQLRRLNTSLEEIQLNHPIKKHEEENQLKQKKKIDLPSPLTSLIVALATFNLYSSYWWTKITLFIWHLRKEIL